MPDLPYHVTVDEIETHLDRVALEIEATGERCLIPLFEWLESQLESRKREDSAMSRVMQRAKESRQNPARSAGHQSGNRE